MQQLFLAVLLGAINVSSLALQSGVVDERCVGAIDLLLGRPTIGAAPTSRM